MARKKKRKGAESHGEEPQAPLPRPAPEKLSRPFAEALRGVTPAPKRAEPTPAKQPAAAPAPVRRAPAEAPPKPRPGAPLGGYEYADRAAFQQAFAGVRPLGGTPRGRRADRGGEAPAARGPNPLDAREEEARRRLDRLVAGEVRFEVSRDEDGVVRGQRAGAHPSHARALVGAVAPQASLDLHGLHGSEAEREVARFVRQHHLAGERVVLVVHGKGRHSSGEIGVLLDHAIHALTEGGAAPYVMAFRSAPERLGGVGALVVRLRDR